MRFYYFVASLLNPVVLWWMRLKTRLQPRERVRIIVINSDKVLLVRPVIGVRKWELPGGMPRHGESLKAAIVRELHEETGVKVGQANVKFVVEYLRPYPMHVHEAHVSSDKIRKNMLEIRDARWFSLSELPADTVPYIKSLLKEK